MSDSAVQTTPTRPSRISVRPRSFHPYSSGTRNLAIGDRNHLQRSNSERTTQPRLPGLHRNITMTRGSRSGSSRQLRSQSAILTSTPKTRHLVPKGTRSRNEPADDSSFSAPSTVSAATTLSLDSCERSDWVSGWLQNKLTQNAVQDMTANLATMSLSASSSISHSDMDISE